MDMPMGDFYAIADANIDLFRGNRIWMDFCGEPLVDPHFFERVRYLNKQGAVTQLSTNGFLLNEENCHALATSGLDYIVVSVSTLDPKMYHRLRGVNQLDTVLKNLQRLKACIDTLHSHTQIQAVAIDTGDLDKETFIRYFHAQGIHAAVHQFTNRALCSRLQFSIKHNYPSRRGVCTGLKQNIAILCNCEVVTCCCDFKGRNSLGNLRDYHHSIPKLIANSRLDAMIAEHQQQIFHGVCAHCSDWIYHQKDAKEEYVTLYPLEDSKRAQNS